MSKLEKVTQNGKSFLIAQMKQEKNMGFKVLAYGHPKDNENKVYQVLEVDDMNQMQEAMKGSRDSQSKNRCRC
jgi:uncharacterized Zn finger protein